MTKRQIIHFIDRDSRMRAELARAAYDLGHHAEVYADFEELLRHPPREGIIVARDEDERGGIATMLGQLTRRGIWLPAIAVSEKPDPDLVVRAMKGGALDFLSLPIAAPQLGASLDRVAQEAVDFERERRRRIEAREKIERLSRREREVVELLVEGHSNKEIARILGISPRTVEIHRANMMKKLAVSHVAEAVRLSIEAGLESVFRHAPEDDERAAL